MRRWREVIYFASQKFHLTPKSEQERILKFE